MGKKRRRLDESDEDMELNHFGLADADVCLPALAKDIHRFEAKRKAPKGLSKHVYASKKTQRLWYKYLVKAWNELKTPPNTPLEATELIHDTLILRLYPEGFDVAELEGILLFYGLPHYFELDKSRKALRVAEDASDASESWLGNAPMIMQDGPVFLLDTLPVTRNGIIDGCCFNVSVEVTNFHILPSKILSAIVERRRALAKGDKHRAHALLDQINTGDYEVVDNNNVEVLTKKFLIKLRFMNAFTVGTEARDMLVKMVEGKCLTIAVYYIDDYKHCVGDAYCDNLILQERLLGGSATCYGKSLELVEDYTKTKKKRKYFEDSISCSSSSSSSSERHKSSRRQSSGMGSSRREKEKRGESSGRKRRD